MLSWLTERRRARLAARPFPEEWEGWLATNVAMSTRLGAEHRARLRDLTTVFVAEKSWEGCGGLDLTDEIRVTIGAQACLLLLGREHALFEDVESILVYPSAMIAPPPARGLFELSRGPIDEGGTPILGQAHLRGPVILAWDDALAGGREQTRGNVVLHELAHKIDMVDGDIDGTPPLPGPAARREWAAVCAREYLELRARVAAGQPSFLDDYGATSEAEFFAVITEAYYCAPAAMRRHEPALYALLAQFYRFEPPARGRGGAGT
jgi:hypothetical protein